jgi:hypothetical protein
MPSVFVALCDCHGAVSESIDTESMLKSIGDEYQVCQTQMTDCLCTPEGLTTLKSLYRGPGQRLLPEAGLQA